MNPSDIVMRKKFIDFLENEFIKSDKFGIHTSEPLVFDIDY